MLKISNLLSKRLLSNSSSSVLSKNVKNKKIKTSLKDQLDNVTKEEDRLAVIKKLRVNRIGKRLLWQPRRIYWEVVGSGGYGGPSSLLLCTEHAKYLFNCGEGTQRVLGYSKALFQLEHVFITSKTWRYLGGLPALGMAIRAAGATAISIYGPAGCREWFQANHCFGDITDDGGEVFEAAGVKVEQVKLLRNMNKKCPAYPTTWTEEVHRWRKDYDNTVQAYICNFTTKPGKLDMNKCADLGVGIKGPMLGMLKAGKDVTLDRKGGQEL